MHRGRLKLFQTAFVFYAGSWFHAYDYAAFGRRAYLQLIVPTTAAREVMRNIVSAHGRSSCVRLRRKKRGVRTYSA